VFGVDMDLVTLERAGQVIVANTISISLIILYVHILDLSQ
jgi:hypothetical protein